MFSMKLPLPDTQPGSDNMMGRPGPDSGREGGWGGAEDITSIGIVSQASQKVALWLQGPELDEQLGALEQQFGGMRGGQAQWASCVRILDPTTLQTHHALELDNNEAAVSLCLARFSAAPEEGALLCVGTVKGLSFYPRRADGAQYFPVYHQSIQCRCHHEAMTLCEDSHTYLQDHEDICLVFESSSHLGRRLRAACKWMCLC